MIITRRQEARSLGQEGELLVKEYLIRKGFAIIASNLRMRGGEIDIIAQKKSLMVCVEVKTRAADDTDMAELISSWQQKRIITTAQYFLAHHKVTTEVTCRFDVALIHRDTSLSLMYIEDAFQEGGS
jgi:putative endonuclease